MITRRTYSNRRGLNIPVVPIAPLIDIVFLLLVFFMLVASFDNPALEVTLPDASTANNVEQQSVTIYIDSSRKLFFDNQPITWNSLNEKLSGEASEIELVRINADKLTPYQDIVRLMDAVRAAGITGIALDATLPKEIE